MTSNSWQSPVNASSVSQFLLNYLLWRFHLVCLTYRCESLSDETRQARCVEWEEWELWRAQFWPASHAEIMVASYLCQHLNTPHNTPLGEILTRYIHWELIFQHFWQVRAQTLFYDISNFNKVKKIIINNCINSLLPHDLVTASSGYRLTTFTSFEGIEPLMTSSLCYDDVNI